VTIDGAEPQALGATVVEERVVPGTAWTVLEDPEGNVFCVGGHA
jgi:hypothetical protein